MRCRRPLLLTVTILLALGSIAEPAQDLPIFDAHIHYSQPDWAFYSPEAILKILDEAGVKTALVSSTPDDGTLRLHTKAPARIVPELRPYRTRDDIGSWYRDPGVLAYVEERLKKGVYKGIGEFHLYGGQTATPVIKRLVELAVEKSLVLHAHSDEAAVRELLALDPRVKILWAHAGMSAGPDLVGALLDRFPTLWVELALRSDVAPSGQLDPAWRALFLRHPDRFMVGTDTWVTSRWADLPASTAAVRAWLNQLPRDVAEKIAFQNAERLFAP